MTEAAAPDIVRDEWLTPPERMAVAYAPRAFRDLWTGLIAFDRRLSEAARESREPIMVQLRLSWWRDRLAQPAAQWPQAEPLLALLAAWDAERAALGALVDGWEARVVGDDGGAALGEARIASVEALARLSRARSDADLREAARHWWEGLPPGPHRLDRPMRPLLVLTHFASADPKRPLVTLLGAMRRGLFGR